MVLSSDNSAANWPEAPTYSYRGLNANWILGGTFMAFALLFLALAGFMAAHSVTVPDRHGRVAFGSTEVAAFGIFWMIVGVLAAWGFPRLRPAIALSADGVFAYLKGKPWRFIAWREMVSITQFNSYYRGHHKVSLGIKGPRYTTEVDEEIERFADLCERLTRYAHDHRIPLRATDGWGNPSDTDEL
jgi:hypothetical protein